MVSHIECSAGGSHTFDNENDDAGGVDMVMEYGCSKCDDVWFHEVCVADHDAECINCDPNKCEGSESGHD